MEARYDMEAWAERTSRGRRIFNVGYRMLGTELRDWRLVKAVPMETRRGEGEVAYIWQRGDDPKRRMVRVTTAELPDWGAAHQRLLDELQASMRPDIPAGTGKLSELGDVNFVARDPEADVPASISFTRGNACVTVRSVGEQTIGVGDIALGIDRALGERPPRAQVSGGRVEARPLEVNAQRVKQRLTLIRSLPRQAARGAWLKVIAPDGELRREGNALLYTVANPGTKRVQTYLRKPG